MKKFIKARKFNKAKRRIERHLSILYDEITQTELYQIELTDMYLKMMHEYNRHKALIIDEIHALLQERTNISQVLNIHFGMFNTVGLDMQYDANKQEILQRPPPGFSSITDFKICQLLDQIDILSDEIEYLEYEKMNVDYGISYRPLVNKSF